MGRFLVGAIIGAVIGVLFAPRRGEDTRDELRIRINDLYESGSKRFPEQAEKLQEAVTAGMEVATKRGDEVRQVLNDTRARVIEMVRKEAADVETGAAEVKEAAAEAEADIEAGKAAEETGK